jgi:hypothetical protein
LAPDVAGVVCFWLLAAFSIRNRRRCYFAGKKELILEVDSLRFVHSKPAAVKLAAAREGLLEKLAMGLWLLRIMAMMGDEVERAVERLLLSW